MKKHLLGLMICLLLSTLAVAPSARAEEIHSSESQITVLPAKYELTSNQDQKIEHSLKIINDSEYDYLYAISIDNIGLTGENGEVTIGDNANNLSNVLANWILLDKNSGTLKAKSTEYIKFSVNVPANAEPGGKYASIVISSDKIIRNPGESQGSAKVVSLLMLTVAGDYEENAKILSFDISANADHSYDLVTRTRNQGVAHIKPEGTVVITNLLGTKISELPFDGDNVLPGSTRKTTLTWKPEKTLFGIYNATLVANYGKNNSLTLTAHQRLGVFPFWPTLAIILIFFVLISAIVFYSTRKHRRTK